MRQGGLTSDPTNEESGAAIDYATVEESERFRNLKRTQRSFIFPLAVFFLLWYFGYVLLAAFAPEFMGQRVWGDITIGLLFGLGQFVTTFIITMWYVAFANRKLDPVAAEIRDDLEKAQVS